MKHNITMFCILGMLSWASCSSNRQEVPANTTPETTVKTVVVDTVHVQKDAQKEGTEIKISEQGMSVENKSGNKKTNVLISGDSSKVEISRPK